MTYTIALLPGDGIGPEVTKAARLVLEVIADKFSLSLTLTEHHFGGAALDVTGDPFPAETEQACKSADAIFLGAVGGPKWEGGQKRPEQGLLGLRKALGLFANLRPVAVYPGLEHLSPLRQERVKNADILIVRELTGGVYFGERVEGTETASDICTYSREEVERIAIVAFEAARKRKARVTSVDKANVLATSRLWRHVVEEVHRNYRDITLEHVLVDAMAMKLIQSPAQFDVILTENMFGDILSDEASVIPGSIGLSPSASLGRGSKGLYEPIHGSAPDIAGKNMANPIGAILSAAMLLRFSLGQEQAAMAIEAAVSDSLAAGEMTGELGGSETTTSLTAKIIARMKA